MEISSDKYQALLDKREKTASLLSSKTASLVAISAHLRKANSELQLIMTLLCHGKGNPQYKGVKSGCSRTLLRYTGHPL